MNCVSEKCFSASERGLLIMSPWFWLAVTIACVLIELCTLALTTLWFAFGGFAAMIVSWIWPNSVVIPCVAFAVVSVLCILLVRPSVVKRFNSLRTRTNVDTVIGKVAKVIVAVNNEESTGRVSLGGIEWAARAVSDTETIPVGTMVEILRVEGVKVIVKVKEG